MTDTFAVVVGVVSALVLLWGVTDTARYLLWARRGRPYPGPSRSRLRLALFAVAIVLGAILGLLLGGWRLVRGG